MADGQFGGGGPTPPTNPAPLSLLEMAQTAMGTGDNPYGGKTLAEIVIGGLPYNMNAGDNGRPIDGGAGGFAGGGGGGFDANAWLNRPATNENVSDAIGRGGQYRPEFARTLQSSGAEGGFFSIPGTQSETNIPWGYYDDPRKENPAPGLAGMSTNNWRLLPRGYQDPKYAMRAGHIIDRYWADKPGAYVGYMGSPGANPTSAHGYPFNLGQGGHGYPLSFGLPFSRGHFFPGQLEPWAREGDPGVT